MNSIWLSLLWKEWREQRWKMAALTVLMACLPILSLLFFGFYNDQQVVQSVLLMPASGIFVYSIVASLFVGMSVSAGENARNTSTFLRGLPVSMWQPGSAKLLTALLVLVVPLCALVLMEFLLLNWLEPNRDLQLEMQRELNLAFGWRLENLFLSQLIVGLLGVTSLLIWTVAIGVNRSDEVRAGAISFLVIAASWLVFVSVMIFVEKYIHRTSAIERETIMTVFPGGVALAARLWGGASSGEFWRFVCLATTVHGILIFWFLKRFARVGKTTTHEIGDRWSFGISKNAAPFSSPTTAIIWKQILETGPLAIIAAGGVLAIVTAIYWWQLSQGGQTSFSDMLKGVAIMVGVLVTLVTGIGVLLEDYAPGVVNFWRSRPINLHAWFAVKYLTGFAVLVLSFGALLIFATELEDWQDVTLTNVSFIVAIFLLIYTMALAAFALLRQPIYTATLTFCCFLVIVATLDVVFNSPNDFWQAVICYTVSLLVLILLAWQAVVRNWGWKQHR
jgi:hypothetical protein